MEPKVMPHHSMSVTEDGGQVVVEWLQDLMQETDQYCGLYEMYVYGGSYKKNPLQQRMMEKNWMDKIYQAKLLRHLEKDACHAEAEEKLGINIQKSNKFITFSCEKEVVELEILLYNEIENLSIMKAVCCGMAGEARSIALDLISSQQQIIARTTAFLLPK